MEDIKKNKRKSLLLLKRNNEEQEIEFELQYLLSLTIQERFKLMELKNEEMKTLLYSHGHRKTSKIIKRK